MCVFKVFFFFFFFFFLSVLGFFSRFTLFIKSEDFFPATDVPNIRS